MPAFPKKLKIVCGRVGHQTEITDADTGEKVDAPIKGLRLEMDANSPSEVRVEIYLEGWVIEGVPVWKMDVDQLREVALSMGFDLAERP